MAVSKSKVVSTVPNLYEATGDSGYTLRIDSRKDVELEGPWPFELMLHALATCLGTGINRILTKKRITIDKLEIDVTGAGVTPENRFLTSIEVEVRFFGAGLSEEVLAHVVALADKHCPVSQTLAKGTPVLVRSVVVAPR